MAASAGSPMTSTSPGVATPGKWPGKNDHYHVYLSKSWQEFMFLRCFRVLSIITYKTQADVLRFAEKPTESFETTTTKRWARKYCRMNRCEYYNSVKLMAFTEHENRSQFTVRPTHLTHELMRECTAFCCRPKGTYLHRIHRSHQWHEWAQAWC